MSKTNPARGMRDFLPADVRKREYVIGIIKEVYESYGFEPLETPAVENLETLMGKYGEEGNQLVFKILKRGEKLAEVTKLQNYEDDEQTSELRNIETSQLSDLALRYDLTVPLARVVANNKNDLPKFFKRYQIQPVWRADRPARGRFREFYQCDVDCIGSESLTVEAEIIAAVCDVLEKLQFDLFRIHVNHREFLDDFLRACDVEESLRSSALVAIDKKDKIGDIGVRNELVDRGLSDSSCERIMDFLYESRDLANKFDVNNLLTVSDVEDRFSSWNLAILKKMSTYVGTEASSIEWLSSLNRVATQNRAGRRLFINPTLARGLSYYTGMISEIDVAGGIGSLGGGGRYDGLIGMFGKEQIPACGFSLGLERILVVMEERGMFPPEIADSTPADVMVTVWNEDTIADSLKLANELRQNGLRVTVYPEPDKFGKQMKYADQIRVPYVCVLGESEIAENKVTLKNMLTGEQETGTLTETVTRIKGHQ